MAFRPLHPTAACRAPLRPTEAMASLAHGWRGRLDVACGRRPRAAAPLRRSHGGRHARLALAPRWAALMRPLRAAAAMAAGAPSPSPATGAPVSPTRRGERPSHGRSAPQRPWRLAHPRPHPPPALQSRPHAVVSDPRTAALPRSGHGGRCALALACGRRGHLPLAPWSAVLARLLRPAVGRLALALRLACPSPRARLWGPLPTEALPHSGAPVSLARGRSLALRRTRLSRAAYARANIR
ncbi:hypothetical protein BS78_02G026300 [Paspalum vaginatum]|nr:hypothetical protein BS78_02G026300 [Paspalum vaginatum]